jgi:predicted phosphodiesterase
MSPVVPAHPQFSEIVKRLRNGEGPKAIAASVEPPVNHNTLKSWWMRHSHTVLTVDPDLIDRRDPDTDAEELAGAVLDERRRREATERKVRVLEAQLKELEAEMGELGDIAELFRGATDRQQALPDWLIPGRKPEEKVATVNLVLSDLHLDEVVKKEAVRGVNAYNRRIAEQRLERTFTKAITLPRDYMSGLRYEGIIVHLAGDTFSGDIHEELARTNEASPLETLLYWLDPFVAGLRMLAEHYGQVHVVSVPGNHDRTHRKPVAKGRVETSLHYVFTKLLEREFRGDTRLTWDAPLSPDALTTVYNTRIMTTHGDQFRGGNGIGGILVPILRGDSRKRQRQQAVGEPYDLLVLGHFHQYISGPGVLINGSLKGYDEYAFQNNFGFETPQQALFLVTPEHGASFHMPIQCANRRQERW